MDPHDLILIGALVSVIVTAVIGSRTARRAMQRYLPGDAAVYGTAEAGKPFMLEIPPGPALDVMLRYRTGTRRYGLTVLVEAARDPAERGFREGARPFELRHERVIGVAAKPIGEAPVAPGEGSYAITRSGGEERRTSVIARLPAGGAGVVRGRIEVDMSADDFVLFAKPS